MMRPQPWAAAPPTRPACAARAAGHHQRVKGHSRHLGLVEQLYHGGSVGRGADGVRAAQRDGIGLAAHRGLFGGHLGHHLLCGAVACPAHIGAKEVVEQQVAVGRRRAGAAQHQHAAQPTTCRGRRRLARMVRLPRPRGDHRLRATAQSVAQQQLELAQLVAIAAQPRQIVALDPHLGPTQRRGQSRQRVQGRRQEGHALAGQAMEQCLGQGADFHSVSITRHDAPVKRVSLPPGCGWDLRPSRCTSLERSSFHLHFGPVYGTLACRTEPGGRP